MLLVLSMVMPIMVGITWLLFNRAENLVHRQIDQHLSDQLLFVESQLRNRQDNIKRIANVIAQRTSVKKILHLQSSLGMNQTLNKIVKVYPYFNYIVVIDKDGEIYAVNTQNAVGGKVMGEILLGSNVKKIDGYKALLNNGPMPGIPGEEAFLSKMGIKSTQSQLFSAPVRRGNRLLGWIVVSYDWQNQINNLLHQTKQRLIREKDPITQILLLDDAKTIVAGGPGGILWESPETDWIKTKPFKIRDKEYGLVISSDKTRLIQPLTNARFGILIGVAITSIALLAGLYFILTYLIARRISKLNTATQAIAAGHYSYRVESLGHDEFGLLAKSFNQMACALFESQNLLEQKVAEQTAELQQQKKALERSNEELDKFAYVASHDLRAPLRGIDQLAKWIGEDLDNKDEARDHLRMMRNRVKRMEKLLDDLLEYSRVGRTKSKWKQINTRELLETSFELATPPTAFQIELDPQLPIFETVAVPFEQVLRNLINNAVKHHHREDGKITVSVEDQGHFYLFKIADDGPGISPKYHDKIFEMFQTLKPRDQVEGSGMGLAMIKKIVSTYGGTISVLSQGDQQGACFCVAWPKMVDPFKKNKTGVFVPAGKTESVSI